MSVKPTSLTACLAALAAGVFWLVLPLTARAAGPATMDGVWRIAHPQTLLTPADGSPLPFTAEGRKLYDANRAAAAKGDLSFDTAATRCGSPGQPRLMLTARPFAIFVRPRLVTILYAWNRLFRQISTTGYFTNPSIGDDWWKFGVMQGRSIGEWQGDTLIVHTTSFQDLRLLDALAPASDKLELTEQMRLTSPDTLQDRITVNDPDIFTRPWDAVVTYARQPDSELPFPEDICFDRLHDHQPGIER